MGEILCQGGYAAVVLLRYSVFGSCKTSEYVERGKTVGKWNLALI
jgi:hypothetical protein